MGVPRSTKYTYVNRIRASYRGIHLRFLAPLGFRQLIGFVEDKELADRLLRARKHNDLRGLVPRWELLNTFSVLSGGKIFLSWNVPPGTDLREARDFLDQHYDSVLLPIQNCTGVRSIDESHVETLSKRIRYLLELSRRTINIRMKMLAYMLISMLDVNPFIRLDELTKHNQLSTSQGLRRPHKERRHRGNSEEKIHREILQNTIRKQHTRQSIRNERELLNKIDSHSSS